MTKHSPKVILTEHLDDTCADWLSERVNLVRQPYDDVAAFRTQLADAQGLVVRTYTIVNGELLDVFTSARKAFSFPEIWYTGTAGCDRCDDCAPQLAAFDLPNPGSKKCGRQHNAIRDPEAALTKTDQRSRLATYFRKVHDVGCC